MTRPDERGGSAAGGDESGDAGSGSRILGHAPGWLVWANLGVVYLVWGSTYLAIRVAVETMPPFLSAGVRFGLAGLIVLGVLAIRGRPDALRVTRPELIAAAIVGALLLLGGNGLVMVAERDVPSGLAALIIGSIPLWVVVLRLIHGERVRAITLGGVALGFVGLAVLVLPEASGSVLLGGVLLLLGADASWAIGTFYSRRLTLPRDPFVSTGYQMLVGGVLLLVAGLLTGELRGLEPRDFSSDSLLAMAYLLVFGSLVAFTSYTWLLQHAPVSRVSTYAYVNPVVAVPLGAIVLNEQVTPTFVVGALIVVAAVAFIVRSDTASQRADTDEPGVTSPASEPTAAEAPGQPGAAGAPGQPAP